MSAVTCTIEVSVPRWRVTAALWWFFAAWPFIDADERLERYLDRLAGFVMRGARIRAR